MSARRLHGLLLALGLVVMLAACGDEEEPTTGEVTGVWLRTSSVDSTRAEFRADGTYEIVQTFNGDPFTPETGTWSLEGARLVRESGEGALRLRNTETFYVDADRLVIGGVFVKTRSAGASPLGEWEAVRGLEQVDGEGAWYRSSWSTRRLSLSDGGRGTVQTVTERDDPSTGVAQAPTTDNGVVGWAAQGSAYQLTGDFEGSFSVLGGLFVDATNAYQRQ